MNFCSLLLLVTISMTFVLNRCEARNALCMPCIGNDCNAEPENCEHGVVRDYCGRRVCAKGPDESCGGPRDVLGKCGEGMYCYCNRCFGCSAVTLQCHNGPGEFCGGPSEIRGKCGEGMHCACSKCTGCSLATLDCYWIERDQLIDCL